MTLIDIIKEEQKDNLNDKQINALISILSIYTSEAANQNLIEAEHQYEYKKLFYNCYKIIMQHVKESKEFKGSNVRLDVFKMYLSFDSDTKKSMESAVSGILAVDINNEIEKYMESAKKIKALKPNIAFQFSSAITNNLINSDKIAASYSRKKKSFDSMMNQMFI